MLMGEMHAFEAKVIKLGDGYLGIKFPRKVIPALRHLYGKRVVVILIEKEGERCCGSS